MIGRMATGTRKRTSKVWDFFELTDTVEKGKKIRKAACKLCDGVYLAYSGGTSNLHSHLEAKHPSKVKDNDTQKHPQLPVVKNCPPARSSKITTLVAEFVARDMRPISSVDGSGFQQLMRYMEPGYKPPSRPFLTTTCRRLYSSLKENVLDILSSPDVYVALTTDLWTSRAIESYLTVTVHYINSEWKLESKVLQTREMKERHTGENIAEALLSVINEWKIDEHRISAIVRDNASNMNVAVEKLGWCDVPCFAHTLQLAINNGLDISSVMSRLASIARKLVGHFKHSPLAMTALKEKQKHLSVPEHHLIQDVATRWNSTYFMYERLLEQRWAIYAVLHDDQGTQGQYKHLYLKEDQWKLLEQLVVVLKALQVATTALCEAEIVSVSLVYPAIHGLLNKHLVSKPDDLPTVKAFKVKVREEILSRFTPESPDIVDRPAMIAAVTDPHYHQLRFLPEILRQHVYSVVKKRISELCPETEEHSVTTEEADQEANKDKQETAMEFLLAESDMDNDQYDELERYLREPPLKQKEKSLDWWSKNGHNFPILSQIAKRYLCIPATSVPAERVFSTAGLVINEKRSSLLPENADMLIFLNKNLPSVKL